MRLFIRTAVLFMMIIGLHGPLIGQQGRVSETEINQQAKFIEANKQKLMGRFEQAAELFLELYREDRENDVIAYELAKVYASLEENEESEKYIKLALELNAEQEYYYRFYIDFLQRNNRLNELKELLIQTRRVFPYEERYTISLAEIFATEGQYENAINLYDELESQSGVREEITRKKFEWYDLMGQEKHAIKELEKLVELYPTSPRYLNNLASYYIQVGEPKKGAEIYQNVLKLDPDNSRASLALANLETQNDSSPEGQLASLESIVSNPNIEIDKKILELIPYVESLDNSSPYRDELLSILIILTESHPHEAKAHAIYGDALFRTEQLAQAADQYVLTIQLNPGVFAVWEQLLYALDGLERYDELADFAMKALDFYPNQAICYYYYGLSQFHNEQFLEASEYLNEGLLLAGQNQELQVRIYFVLSKTAFALSDFEKALTLGNKITELTIDPGPAVYEFLGDINFQLLSDSRSGNNSSPENKEQFKQSAIAHWEKAIELSRGDTEKIRLKIEQAQILR